MSIVITSGIVKGAENVKSRINRAVLRGIKKGILLTLDVFLPTVALKTGLMREAFEDAVDDLLQGFTKVSSQRTLSWKTIKRLTILAVDYAEYHFRARGFYVAPTTAGTKPMRFSSFKALAVPLVNLEVFNSLRSSGLDTRAKFRVR